MRCWARPTCSVVPVRLTVGADGAVDNGADPEVNEEVLRLEVARNRKAARDAAERGDYDGAAEYLRCSIDMLHDSAEGASVVDELRTDIDRLSTRMWSASDAKRHFSRSRSAMKGRRVDFTDIPGAALEDDLDPRDHRARALVDLDVIPADVTIHAPSGLKFALLTASS